MGTINNNSKGQTPHDGQKNYQHSNQRNPDHVRSNPRDHEYKDYNEELTNDANYDINEHQVKDGIDVKDTKDNVGK